MRIVDGLLIVATRPRNEDYTVDMDNVRIAMRSTRHEGMPVWQMTNEAARSLRDQLTEVLGD
jgi:hypothetical protein